MSEPGSKQLVLSDGDLPGLIACAIAAERTSSGVRSMVTLGPIPSEQYADRLRAARAAAESYDFEFLEPDFEGIDTSGRWSARTDMLLRAARTGSSVGCSSLIWPVHAGGERGSLINLEAASAEADLAVLVGRLAMVESVSASRTPCSIDVPFVDLVDRQLADLAADLDVPVRLCWWDRPARTDDPGEAATAARNEQSRWREALDTVGWMPAPNESLA